VLLIHIYYLHITHSIVLAVSGLSLPLACPLLAPGTFQSYRLRITSSHGTLFPIRSHPNFPRYHSLSVSHLCSSLSSSDTVRVALACPAQLPVTPVTCLSWTDSTLFHLVLVSTPEVVVFTSGLFPCFVRPIRLPSGHCPGPVSLVVLVMTPCSSMLLLFHPIHFQPSSGPLPVSLAYIPTLYRLRPGPARLLPGLFPTIAGHRLDVFNSGYLLLLCLFRAHSTFSFSFLGFQLFQYHAARG
jgi:hypothetical protein